MLMLAVASRNRLIHSQGEAGRVEAAVLVAADPEQQPAVSGFGPASWAVRRLSVLLREHFFHSSSARYHMQSVSAPCAVTTLS